MPCWLKLGRAVEYSDVEMGFRRQWSAQTFAGQCRPAPRTKSPPGSSRRRIELSYLPFGDRVGRAIERDKNRSRRAAVLAATLTMAPIHSFGLAGRNKTDGTAQATTFELVGCGAHTLIPLID